MYKILQVDRLSNSVNSAFRQEKGLIVLFNPSLFVERKIILYACHDQFVF